MSNEKKNKKDPEGALNLLDQTERKFYLMRYYENSNVSMTNFIFAMAAVYWSRNITNSQNLTWQFHTYSWHPVKPSQANSKFSPQNTHAIDINILWEFFVSSFVNCRFSVVVYVWNSFFLLSLFLLLFVVSLQIHRFSSLHSYQICSALYCLCANVFHLNFSSFRLLVATSNWLDLTLFISCISEIFQILNTSWILNEVKRIIMELDLLNRLLFTPHPSIAFVAHIGNSMVRS